MEVIHDEQSTYIGLKKKAKYKFLESTKIRLKMEPRREFLKKCKYCRKSFTKESKYVKHKTNCKHQSKNRVETAKTKNSKFTSLPNNCKPCFVSLKRLSDIKIEKYTGISSKSSKKISYRKRKREIEEPDWYSCHNCNSAFNRQSKRRAHTIICNQAKLSAGTVQLPLKLPVQFPVEVPQIRNCTVQLIRLPRSLIAQSTNNEKEYKTNGEIFKCNAKKCKITSTNKALIQFHEFSHHGITKYNCNFCKSDFYTKLSLVQHKLAQHS